MNGEQMPWWYFAQAQDDLNMRSLRKIEGTGSLDAGKLMISWSSKKNIKSLVKMAYLEVWYEYTFHISILT